MCKMHGTASSALEFNRLRHCSNLITLWHSFSLHMKKKNFANKFLRGRLWLHTMDHHQIELYQCHTTM
jgi:hypothetical protein